METIFLLGAGLFFVGIISGSFCAYIAKEKNRGDGAWFVLGFLFSLFALIALVGLPIREKK